MSSTARSASRARAASQISRCSSAACCARSGRVGGQGRRTSTGRARTRRTAGGGSARASGCRPPRTGRRGRRRARPSSRRSACRPRSCVGVPASRWWADDEVGLPVDVALGDRLAQGQRLDLDAHPRQVAQVLEREGSDAEPSLRGGLDEVLGRQSGDRFPHDAEADAVLLGEVPRAGCATRAAGGPTGCRRAAPCRRPRRGSGPVVVVPCANHTLRTKICGNRSSRLVQTCRRAMQLARPSRSAFSEPGHGAASRSCRERRSASTSDGSGAVPNRAKSGRCSAATTP